MGGVGAWSTVGAASSGRSFIRGGGCLSGRSLGSVSTARCTGAGGVAGGLGGRTTGAKGGASVGGAAGGSLSRCAKTGGVVGAGASDVSAASNGSVASGRGVGGCRSGNSLGSGARRTVGGALTDAV